MIKKDTVRDLLRYLRTWATSLVTSPPAQYSHTKEMLSQPADQSGDEQPLDTTDLTVVVAVTPVIDRDMLDQLALIAMMFGAPGSFPTPAQPVRQPSGPLQMIRFGPDFRTMQIVACGDPDAFDRWSSSAGRQY